MFTLDGHQKQSCYGKPFWKRVCEELLDEKARKWQSLNAKRYGEKRKRLGENWQLPMVNGDSIGFSGYLMGGIYEIDHHLKNMMSWGFNGDLMVI